MATEFNFTGFETGDRVELPGGLSTNVCGIGTTTPRTGAFHLFFVKGPLSGNGYYAFFPAGNVIGTSGTTSTGQHKRARVRLYLRLDNVFVPNVGDCRIMGFGQVGGSVGISVHSSRVIGIRIGSNAVSYGAQPLTIGVWYQVVIDVDLAVSSNTLVTASVHVESDGVGTINETVTVSANIGNTDNLDQFGFGYFDLGIFAPSAIFSADDVVYMGTSGVDGANPITLPTATKVTPCAPTGTTVNQWDSGGAAQVDERPVDLSTNDGGNFGDFIKSTAGGNGTTVTLTHEIARTLNIGTIQGWKVTAYVGGVGGGNITLQIGSQSFTLAIGNVAYGAGSAIYNGTLAGSVFDATYISLIKANGTATTRIGTVVSEVLATAHFISDDDYWTFGINGDDGATPVFPASRLLIVSPNVGTNYSRGRAVTMVTGTPLANYPTTKLTDDSADSILRIAETTIELYVDLGVSRTPDVLALLNHNLDPSIPVRVYYTDNPASFTALASFAAGKVNAWLDLRGFPARTARYWKIKTDTGNSAPVSIGEIVIGSAMVMEGSISENWSRAAKYFIERAFTEEMLPYKMHSGARARQLHMAFVMNPTNRAIIEQVFDDAGMTGNRVLVIPDTRKNDPYFIDWPNRRQINFPESLREAKVDLVLTEQSVGVL